MEDAYLRFGLLIVGVAILGVLIAFAMKATDSIDIIEDRVEQSVRGDAEEVVVMVGKLCEACLHNGFEDRDCYVIKAEIAKGALSDDSFGKTIGEDVDVSGPGNYLFKVVLRDHECVVRQIG